MAIINKCSLIALGKGIDLKTYTKEGEIIKDVLLYDRSSFLKKTPLVSLKEQLMQTSNQENIIIDLTQNYIRDYKDLFIVEVIDEEGSVKGLVGDISKILEDFVESISKIEIDCNCNIKEDCCTNFDRLSYTNYFLTLLKLEVKEDMIKHIIELYDNLDCSENCKETCFNPFFTIVTVNNEIKSNYV